jgi:hypothetical protein
VVLYKRNLPNEKQVPKRAFHEFQVEIGHDACQREALSQQRCGAACGCSNFLDDRPYLTTDWLGRAQNSSSESSLSWTLLIADEASLPLKSEYFSLSSSESRDSIPDVATGFAAGFGAGAMVAG